MTRKQKIKLTFPTTAFILLLNTQVATPQQDPARCELFHKLLNQKGLQVSAILDHDFVFTEEMLEPTIVIRNTTTATLEIPSIESSMRPLMANIVDSFGGSQPKLEKCSVQTEKLLPGEQRSFPINYDVGPLFPGSDKEKDQYMSQAGDKVGERNKTVRIGYSSINLSYRTVMPKLEYMACVFIKPNKGEMKLKLDEDNNEKCLVTSIFSHSGKFYLMSSSGAYFTVASYLNDLRLASLSSMESRSLYLSRLTPIRVAEFDHPIQFDPKSAQEAIPVSSFKLYLADGTQVSLKQIEAQWEERRRQRGRL